MIVFDLGCGAGHRFEGWFASGADFENQQARGLVQCPHCGSAEIAKAPMAPAVPRKGNQLAVAKPAQEQTVVGGAVPKEMQDALGKLAQMQANALKGSRWVGKDFAEQSREMHYGERETETIHGQATIAQAKELWDEGVPLMPLPFPVTPPEELN